MSEIRHGDTVTSKFFKGTGVVVGTSTVISDRKVTAWRGAHNPDAMGGPGT